MARAQVGDATALTLDYYDTHAEAFADATADVEFSAIQQRFIRLLAPGADVLDLGCGSGRDTLAFMRAGLNVVATDGSAALCEIARSRTGAHVRHERFQDLADLACYDGVWACSSLLHLADDDLRDVCRRIVLALRPQGILYLSFKYGRREGVFDGRYFHDLTEEGLHDLLAASGGLALVESWVSADVRPGREGERWLNALARRL